MSSLPASRLGWLTYRRMSADYLQIIDANSTSLVVSSTFIFYLLCCWLIEEEGVDLYICAACVNVKRNEIFQTERVIILWVVLKCGWSGVFLHIRSMTACGALNLTKQLFICCQVCSLDANCICVDQSCLFLAISLLCLQFCFQDVVFVHCPTVVTKCCY